MAINVEKWIEENKSSFLPPVCNKLMHGAGELKVMFIGGPNQRKDYHLDEGEEIFYQVKGDMVLKVIEKGVHKDIAIKEGQVFLLPSRVPHSPQRYKNTVGFVMERDRTSDESDGLRYYVEGTTDTLWEHWFHCTDLGTQLGPIIKTFFASEECKTGRPPPGKVFPPPPMDIDTTTTLMEPIDFKEWIASNSGEIDKGRKMLFGQNGEFKFTVWGGDTTEEGCYHGEAFVWQLEGVAKVSCDQGTVTLGAGDSLLFKAGEKFTIQRQSGAIGFTVTTDPLANKQK